MGWFQCVSLLDEQTVWVLFVSEVEAEISRATAAADLKGSLFFSVKRWMEILERPPRTYWVRMRGLSLHIWRASVFHKLGDCLGRSMEADQDTISLENLQYGRVKILLGESRKLLTKLRIWWDDLSVVVEVE